MRIFSKNHFYKYLANILLGIFIASLLIALFKAFMIHYKEGVLTTLFWMVFYALPPLVGIVIVELFIEIKEISQRFKKLEEYLDSKEDRW